MTLVLSPQEIVKKLETQGRLGLLARHDSWERRPLGELCSIQNGAPFASSLFNNMGLGMPLIRIRDISKNITETCYSGPFENAFVVSSGDLLIGMDGDFRLARWMGAKGLLNQRVCRLVVTSQLLNKTFVELVVPGYLDAIWKETSSTTVKHLSSRSISEIPIPIPPLDEQEKIVEILEEQLSHLDAALASVRAVRTKAARFRRSLLHAAFTGALTGRDSFSEAALPAGWGEKQLGEIADVGWGDLQVTKSSFVENGFLAYSAAGPDGFREDFDFDQDGIVLSAIGAGCGRTWYAKGRWSCIKNTIRILEKSKDIRLDFLYQQLSDPDAWPKRGSGQPFISQKDARELIVKVPPLDEQSKIVKILEEQLSRLDAALEVADVIEKKASALRRLLLHAAFTGNLTKEWREGAHV